jgi:acetyltransferase-like isoleucine patch superfamily enzyme
MAGSSLLNRLFSTLESRSFPFRVSWWRTIYFNLRSLPLAQAIRLPVYIHSHTVFVTLSGTVEIRGRIRPGMIQIGKREDRGQGVTIIRNLGKMVLSDEVKIMQGCDIYVGRGGFLEIGARARIRENVFIYASNHVSIGELTGIAYQCTISDDDFHYILDVDKGQIDNSKAAIVIGNRNWIGSRTVIKKGTVTPDDIIVASSYAVLGKDYRESVPKYSVIGGIPARVLRTNARRVFNRRSEESIHQHFDNTDDPYLVNLDPAEVDAFCR